MLRALLGAGQLVKRRARMAVWRARLGHLGRGTFIYPSVVVLAPRRVRLGNDVVLNDFVHIWGAGGLEIGDACLVAAHCVITTQTHDSSALGCGLTYRETAIMKPVRLGRNVWLGAAVTVLPGVTIGDNAIVGACSLVTTDLPANSISFGTPARVRRMLD